MAVRTLLLLVVTASAIRANNIKDGFHVNSIIKIQDTTVEHGKREIDIMYNYISQIFQVMVSIIDKVFLLECIMIIVHELSFEFVIDPKISDRFRRIKKCTRLLCARLQEPLITEFSLPAILNLNGWFICNVNSL